MAKVIGFKQEVYKRYTCSDCAAIIEYAPNEEYWSGHTDEGSKIMGIKCPNCGVFVRTNP